MAMVNRNERRDIRRMEVLEAYGKPSVSLTPMQWFALLEHVDIEIEAAADRLRGQMPTDWDDMTIGGLKTSEALRNAIREQLGLDPLVSEWDEIREGR